MNINTTQYRQGVKGCFLSANNPSPGERLTLIMPTCRGKRIIPVGIVSRVEPVGSSRFLVWVSALQLVEGMNY